MRVAILAPEFIPTWGGVGIYTVELVRELARYSDLEIHVITPRLGEGYDPKTVLGQIKKLSRRVMLPWKRSKR
ncbi:MAG: hypothetical protein V1743_01960 [Nanoarchaeota archaeon]